MSVVSIERARNTDLPQFIFTVDSLVTGEEIEELDLFSFDSEDEGDEPVEGLEAYSLKRLAEILSDGKKTEETKKILSDLKFIKKASASWGGQSPLAAFLLDGWLILKGSPGYRLSKALKAASTETMELLYEHGTFAAKLGNDTKELANLHEQMVSCGVSQTPDLVAALGAASSSVSTITENARLAQEEGFRVLDVYPSGRQLKPHQKTAVLSLAYTGGGLLADQVGLGKGGEFTCAWETTKLYLTEVAGRDRRKIGPAVISVTKSMVGEIANEVSLWAGDDANIVVLSGRKKQEIPYDVDYVVLNHDILSARLDELIALRPTAFIADEAHVFKTPTAKRSIAAVELADSIRKKDKDAFICMATGTPFLNRPVELWGVLRVLGTDKAFADFALRHVPKSVEYWSRGHNGRFVSKIGRTSDRRAFEIFFCAGRYDRFHTWHNSGASHTDILHELLVKESGMVRRKKSDVIHPLPPVLENIVDVTLSQEARDNYMHAETVFHNYYLRLAEEVAKKERVNLEKAFEIAVRKLSTSEHIMRLSELRKLTSIGKGEAAVEWIVSFLEGTQQVPHPGSGMSPVGDDESRKKLIVFTHYRDVRKFILEHPEIQKYDPVTILPGGDQSDKSIQAHKKRFQEDPSCRLMVCSMAAREGHTLTAAKDILVVDVPYVPSWVVQIAGRCWARMSELYEPHEATIHYMVASGTVDAKVISSVRAKKKVFDAVIDNEGADDVEKQEEDAPEELLDGLIRGTLSLGVAR